MFFRFQKMLVKRTLVLVFLYQAMRAVFLLINYKFFPSLTWQELFSALWGSFKFDLSAIMYLSVVYYFMFLLPVNLRNKKWYQSIGMFVFLLPHAIAIVFNLADVAYYSFTLHRTNASFFQEFKNDTNLLLNAGSFLRTYWYVFVSVLGFVLVLCKSYCWIKMPEMDVSSSKKRASELLLLPFVVLLWLGLARGSFNPSDRPAGVSAAGEYVIHPEHTNIVLNTPFSIMMTWGNTLVPEVNYFATLEEAATYYNPLHHLAPDSSASKKNVVIIIVESMSKEFVGAYNSGISNYTGYMPFLDSLISHSLTFQYGYSNGKRSVEALPSITSAIPTAAEAYILTPHVNNKINSLATVLKKYGYHTSFYHGGHRTTMNFAQFCRIAGFEKTFSKDDYPDPSHFDGAWAIWDEEYLQYFAQELNRGTQPFLSVIFTATSHHPFKIPVRYSSAFPKGTLDIHQSMGYTDYALKRFFETASKMPWYKNTLFVITADHAATQSAYADEYYNPQGFFAVPIVFFTPDSSLLGFRNELAQHTDIFPTVIDYLCLGDSIVAFGTSLLQQQRKPVVICFSGLYQLFDGDYLLQFDGAHTTAMYNFKTDPGLKINQLNTIPDAQHRMETCVKAFIQQYNTRVRNNKMLPQ